MFHSSAPFAFFEYFRIPYTVAEHAGVPGPSFGSLGVGDGPRLAWPLTGGRFGSYRLGGIPIFARISDPAIRASWGSGWQAVESVTDDAGNVVASVWRDAYGNVLLPFDPAEVMWRYWSEHYQDTSRAAAVRAVVVRAYYFLRPAIPRPMQIRLRRAFLKVQDKAQFPAFPIEPALHDFYGWMFRLVGELAGGDVPYIAPWPAGHSWALVLTHDVETAAGLDAMNTLRDIERDGGHVSSWNFVPQRYDTPSEVTDGLKAEGCEVGVHGLLHDGRDLASLRLLRGRLPAIRGAADRWGADGFRSPATQRTWEWMPLLGFAYDSSYHDTAPYEPRPGGSCSYLPYFIGSPGAPGDMVELPITLPMDHTLFEIMQQPDASLWLSKVAYLRDHGGLALILTHPDYAVADPRITAGYRAVLERYADDPSVWRALPGEVASWWQRRALSTLTCVDGAWAVCGPASDDGEVSVYTPELSANVRDRS